MPAELKTRTQPIVSIPFTQGCNDIASGLSTSLRRSIARAIGRLPKTCPTARVMATLVDPIITGVAHRVRHLREALVHIASHPHGVFITAKQIFRRRPRDGTG